MKTLTKILLAAIGMTAGGIEAQTNAPVPFLATFTASDSPGVTMYNLWQVDAKHPLGHGIWLGQSAGTNIGFTVSQLSTNPAPLYVDCIAGTNSSLPSAPFLFDTNNYPAYYAWLQTNNAVVIIPQTITIDPPNGLNVPSPK